MVLLKRLVFSVIILAAVLASGRLWLTHHALSAMHEAPFGQAVGPEDAAISVVEFIDYRCPACRGAYPVMEEVIAANPDVRFVFQPVPATSEDAITDTRLALAAGHFGKFKPMHDRLMMRGDEAISEEDIALLAEQLGIDHTALSVEMMTWPVSRALVANLIKAWALKVDAFPSLLINDTYYKFPQDLPPSAESLNSLLASLKAEKEK